MFSSYASYWLSYLTGIVDDLESDMACVAAPWLRYNVPAQRNLAAATKTDPNSFPNQNFDS
jgi:hypothetical protein